MLDASLGVGACTIGIFLGDIALWIAGRMIERRLRKHSASRPMTRRQIAAVLIARFVPGMRFPVYLGMGTQRVDGMAFALWNFIAAAVWTPLLVLMVAYAGDAVAGGIERYLGTGWIAIAAAVVLVYAAVRVAALLATEIGRCRLIAAVSKIWRWEFWPSWLFYLPLLPWIAWLSVRHRGFLTITASNPGIPHGGFVGESKFQILQSIHSPHVIPTQIIRAADAKARLTQLGRILQMPGFSLPLILKPDAGQRGAGVKLIRRRIEAAQYLLRHAGDTMIQPYHPGPCEAGIFYYREPGAPCGRIFSITDKQFACVCGDGRSTLEQLIWRHPRYRMQAGIYLQRHDPARVLADGETLQLAIAGNHCQGTCFRDGSHLLTPALEAKIDAIAQTFDGFFFGRFDVRYANPRRLMQGEDFAIVELNGATSESTNLYDPSWSLLRAYRQLFAQWSLLFRIAAANRAKGHAPSGFRDLLHTTRSFYTRARETVAD
jgi:hypothetical protein